MSSRWRLKAILTKFIVVHVGKEHVRVTQFCASKKQMSDPSQTEDWDVFQFALIPQPEEKKTGEAKAPDDEPLSNEPFWWLLQELPNMDFETENVGGSTSSSSSSSSSAFVLDEPMMSFLEQEQVDNFPDLAAPALPDLSASQPVPAFPNLSASQPAARLNVPGNANFDLSLPVDVSPSAIPNPAQSRPFEEKKQERPGKRPRIVEIVTVGLAEAQRYYPEQVFESMQPQTFVQVQSYAILRWSWLRIVDAATVDLKNNSCLEQIRQVFVTGPQQLIKAGQYGFVYEASLANSPYKFPVALKFMNQNITKNTYKEVIAMAYLNSLVSMNICPHYPLLYQPFLCVEKIVPLTLKELTILQEFANGDLSTWLKQKRDGRVLMGMIFQVCVGILGALTLLQIVNNDIKSDNILFNDVLPNTRFSYNVFGTEYHVDSYGTLFKIADWGLVTGNFVDRDHDVPPSLRAQTPVELASWNSEQAWEKKNYDMHPLAYRVNGMPIPYQKRDFLMFFYMLLCHYSLPNSKQANMPTEWLKYAVNYVTRTKMSTTSEIISVFHHLFSANIVAKQNKTWLNLFHTPTPLNANVNDQKFSMQHTVLEPVPIFEVIQKTTLQRLPVFS
jgi:hypothetical protein